MTKQREIEAAIVAGMFDGDPVQDETGIDERDPPQPDEQDDPALDEETR